MAAGQGYIEFATGDVLTAASANGYLASQVVMVFADAASRTSAIASPQEGMISYLKDTDVVQTYSGSAWVTVGGAASPLTTKGDLYGYSTIGARVPVGTNGQVLTADSTASTGVTWATPSGASLPTFSAYANTNQNVTQTTWTKVTFGTEDWDTNNNFASSRFTPTVAGYYSISGRVDLSGLTNSATVYLAIYKNGTNYKTLSSFTATQSAIGFGGNSAVYFNGLTDYVELYVYASSGSGITLTGIADATWFNGIGVRA